jgi:carboxyl-terminal processing protease
LYARQAFARFAERFSAEGDTRFEPVGARRIVSRGFVVDDALVQEFKGFLRQEKMTIDEAAFAKDIEFIRAMIRYDIDIALFGVEEARGHLVAKDPQAQYALTFFPEAERLTQLARNRVPAQER